MNLATTFAILTAAALTDRNLHDATATEPETTSPPVDLADYSSCQFNCCQNADCRKGCCVEGVCVAKVNTLELCPNPVVKPAEGEECGLEAWRAFKGDGACPDAPVQVPVKTTILNLFHSSASLLPGDTTDCLDPTNLTDTSCNGGLAAVAAVIRNSELRGDGPSFHIPFLDRSTKFSQMHPSKLGVNELISHEMFGWGAFITSPSIFYPVFDESSTAILQSHEFGPVLTNQDLPSSSLWAPYTQRVHFDHQTKASFIFIANEDLQYVSPGVESLVTALDHVAKLNRDSGCYENVQVDNEDQSDNQTDITCWLPPVVFFDHIDNGIKDACLKAALGHKYPPLVFYDHIGDNRTPAIYYGKTAVFSVLADDDMISQLHIEAVWDSIDNSLVVKTVNLTETNIRELPTEYKDKTYVENMKQLRVLADEAIQNDPVIGTSEEMPFTRIDDWRICMGGECPIGNLFTDALRQDADFSVLNSGGFRGPGWPAGEVHISDVWGALPFVNYRCTGVMSGVSVFNMLNYSTSYATFESTFSVTGDRLVQMSGMKMSYNTLLNATRLISVDVWDEEAKDYLPLDRLKLYKFASDNWMCDYFDEFPNLLKNNLMMEGEVPGTVDESKIVQEIVADYLMNLNATYNTTLRGSHINNTKAFKFMSFIQTKDLCSTNTYWNPNLLSCSDCPGVENVTVGDDLISFLITPDSEELRGRNVLYNKESFNVTLSLKSAPVWVVFRESANKVTEGSKVLQPGESIAVEFYIDPSSLNTGTTRSTVSFGLVLDHPGCITPDITFDAFVELRSEDQIDLDAIVGLRSEDQIGRIRPTIGLTLTSLTVCMAVFFAAWTHKNRKHQVVKAGQPLFLQLICVGIFIMALSIIPLSAVDSAASPEGASVACMAVPWLFSGGFCVTFSALFAKLWRIHRVMVGAQRMQRTVVLERDALKLIAVFLTNQLILLICWTAIDPLSWEQKYINDDPSNTYGSCSGGMTSTVFLVMIVALDFSALALACERAYRSRNIDDQFSESRYVFLACLSWIQLLVLGILMMFITKDNPTASYFTRVAIIFLVCASMLLFMFAPKMKLMTHPQAMAQMIQTDDPRFQLEPSSTCNTPSV